MLFASQVALQCDPCILPLPVTFYSLPVTHILLPVTHFTPPSKFWSIQIPIRATVALDVFDKSIVTLSPSEEQEARWRRTEQRAIATARPAAPCTSNVLREAWCLRLLSLRSFTRDWWQDRQNRAPVHRQNSSRISKLPPQPTHVALAALVW